MGAVAGARASEWPMAAGVVESAEVVTPGLGFRMGRGRGQEVTADLRYSYVSPGGRYAGSYRRDFGCEEEAYEFVRDLKGKPVMVH